MLRLSILGMKKTLFVRLTFLLSSCRASGKRPKAEMVAQRRLHLVGDG